MANGVPPPPRSKLNLSAIDIGNVAHVLVIVAFIYLILFCGFFNFSFGDYMHFYSIVRCYLVPAELLDWRAPKSCHTAVDIIRVWPCECACGLRRGAGNSARIHLFMYTRVKRHGLTERR